MRIPTFAVAAALAAAFSLPAQQPSADAKAMAAAITAFGHDLQQELASDANWCWSPASVAMALDLALLGARGDTEAAIAKTLHLVDEGGRPWPTDRVQKALADLRGWIEKAGGQAEMNVVNDVWGQKDYGFLDSYREAVKSAGATFRELDFAEDAEAARRFINDYIAENTRQRIQNLIPPGGVSGVTRDVLTNAVYFKGAWVDEFPARATADRPFTLADGGRVDVPTMARVDYFGYAERDGFAVATLGYDRSRLAMALLLPDEGVDLATVRKTLAPESWDALRQAVEYRRLELHLPKFELRSQFALAPVLAKLGMGRAFDARSADFSGVNGGAEPLAIDAVIHKTFIKVDEKGTEAAAATAVMRDGAAERPAEPTPFHVDRPFLAVVYDRVTGLPLFVTQVTNPKVEG